MTQTRIAIVDYGMGNRRSVEKALARVGARPQITDDHDAIRAADGLVVPGVGAFPRAMANLADRGLDELLRERAAAGAPVLGVCLGMQLLFERSSEREAAAFYHVHSFACRPSEPGDVVGRGEYGEPLASVVERGNVSGVQFHPEKSSRDGLALLANFARTCASTCRSAA